MAFNQIWVRKQPPGYRLLSSLSCWINAPPCWTGTPKAARMYVGNVILENHQEWPDNITAVSAVQVLMEGDARLGLWREWLNQHKGDNTWPFHHHVCVADASIHYGILLQWLQQLCGNWEDIPMLHSTANIINGTVSEDLLLKIWNPLHTLDHVWKYHQQKPSVAQRWFTTIS